MNSSSQFDKIWCLQYDQDSYHRPMVKINFSKYLNSILSNQYFPAFQVQVFKQLNNQSQWNERSWAILQFFEYFNNHAFAIKEFESNVKFIADQKIRKTFGSFRMWIDLERLYLLTFLKMDRIQFQEDRIFFSLYRTMYFLHDLFTQYQVSDFKRQYLIKIQTQIKAHLQKLQKCIPSYMHVMLKAIRQMIPNFINKYPLVDFKDKDQAKKLAYRKLSRQYDMMPDIQQRLLNNIKFQQKGLQQKQIDNIVQSQSIKQLTKQVQPVYDPKIRITAQYKKQVEQNNKQYDQNKLNELLKSYYQKNKQKTVNQNPYQSLMRTGHNPYDQSNYAIHGEGLGIDMNEKQNLQKFQQMQEVEQESDYENPMLYDPRYIQKIQGMQVNSVAITNKDLNNKASLTNRNNHYSQDNSTLLKNLDWKKQRDYVDDDDDNDDKQNAMTTLRSINLRKNLENNALFQKHQEEEKQKSMQILTKMFKKGYQSNILFNFQKKADLMFNEMNQSRMISVKNKTTIERSKFDTLRKVAQLHSVNRKIHKWLQMYRVPSLYPRSIDEIKKFNVDTTIQNNKRQLAVQTIFQT